MLPELTAEQEMFRDVTRRYLESLAPVDKLRQHDGSHTPLDRAAWAGACDLGWLTAMVPESLGGFAQGSGATELALIGVERGRHLSSGPLHGAVAAIAALIQTPNTGLRDAWIGPITEGRSVVGWLGPRSDRHWVPGDGFTARASDDGVLISGVCSAAEWAIDTDVWLVTATDEAGATIQVLIAADQAGISITSCESLDISRTFGCVTLHEVSVAEGFIIARGQQASTFDDQQIALGLLQQCSELLGALDTAIDSAIDYSQDRFAFGRPIGSFQAIKHMIADAAVAREASRAALTLAVRACGEADDAAGVVAALRATRVAKSYIGDAAIDVIERALQVFGGIGFTWDHHIHLYLRKAATDRELLGTPDFHRTNIFSELVAR